MNWDHVEGNWKQVKGKVIEHWGKFTDDELDILHGKREQFVGKPQEKYGISSERAEEELNDFLHKLH